MDHRLKLDHARKHAEKLKEAIRVTPNPAPYQFVREFDAQSGEYAVRMILGPLPIEWSLILGDALHNMRSALDSLVYRLSVAHLGVPTDREVRRIGFPIVDSDDEFDDRIRHNQGPYKCDPRVVALIKGMQPYQPSEWGYGNPLQLLRDLNNIDKHRHLVLARIHISDGQFQLSRNGENLGEPVAMQEGVFDSGEVIARYTLPAGVPDSEVHLGYGFGSDYTFSHPWPVKYPGVQALTDVLLAYLPHEIFRPLEPFLNA